MICPAVSRSSFLLLIINLHHDAKAAARLGSAFSFKFSRDREFEEAKRFLREIWHRGDAYT